MPPGPSRSSTVLVCVALVVAAASVGVGAGAASDERRVAPPDVPADPGNGSRATAPVPAGNATDDTDEDDGWTGPAGPQRDLDGPGPGAATVGTAGAGGPGPAGATAGDDGEVRLLVTATSAAAVDAAAVRAVGGTVRARHGRLIEVRVPADRVADLRATPWVASAGAAPRALPAALSEGVAVSNASAVHELNVTGANVTVGVLDVGFDPTEENVSDQVLDARAFGTDIGSRATHGTAVAETVAETAPDAGLYLAAFEGATGHVEAVEWLDERDVDVIVMAYSWPYQPADGTGWASETAAGAVANGSVWVSAAGNDGRRHWSGTFSNPDRTRDNGDRFHNFYFGDDGNDELNGLGDPDARTSDDDLRTLEPGDRIDLALEWDDWPNQYPDRATWRAESADYALHLYNSSGLVRTVDRSHGTYDQPLETLQFEVKVEDTYSVAITNVTPTTGDRPELELYTFGTYKPQYRTAEGSLLAPAAREEVTTVGAAAYESGELRAYSSRGPTDDGRRGVDLLGPDGTASDVYGGPFFGSSASAAHVGGAAALVRAADPTLSVRAVDERLRTTATDVVAGPATVGPDPATGYGRVDALAAVEPSVGVAGRIVDADGDALASRSVRLVAGDGSSARTVGLTNGDGRFDLRRPGTPATPADLGVGPAGAPAGDGVPDVYALTRVGAVGERDVGTRSLPRAVPGTVRVVDAAGAPASNATVEVVHEGAGGASATATFRTNASGALVRPTGKRRIDAVGDVVVRATGPDGATGVRRLSIDGDDAAWNATVRLPAPARWALEGFDAPAEVVRGDPATAAVTVTHVDGGATNATDVAVRIDADGDGVLSPNETVARRTVTVPPGEAERLTFDLDTERPVGDYRVGIVADGRAAPNATTAVSRNVTVVAEGAVLNVTGVEAPTRAIEGEVVRVRATVRNEGDRPTDDDVVVLRADLDGNGAVEPDEGLARTNVLVGPGNETTADLFLNTTGFDERAYRIGVFSPTGADSAGSRIDVRALARYAADVDADDRVRRGRPLDVRARLTNEGGSVGANGTVSLRVDRDGDGTLSANETVESVPVGLAPAGTRTVSFAAATDDLALREYAYGVVTPTGRTVARTQVAPASARTVVESVTGPASVDRNESVTVEARVRNVGGLAGNETAVSLRLDTDRDGRPELGETVDGTTVRLGRDEATTVRLVADRTAVRDLGDHYYGFHVVTVNGSRSVSTPVGSPAVFPDGVPGTGPDPPTNVDDDGRLEDVNGDGALTFSDVIDLLFVDTDVVNATRDRRAAFDFDGDGDVDISDVIELLFEVP